jgi:hypothetical protein
LATCSLGMPGHSLLILTLDRQSADEDEGEFYENSDDNKENAVEAAQRLYYWIPTAAYCCAVPRHYSSQECECGVMMATAQLYWHLAPKPVLVRLLSRCHDEVQAIVLNSIASMTIKSQGGSKMFQST